MEENISNSVNNSVSNSVNIVTAYEGQSLWVGSQCTEIRYTAGALYRASTDCSQQLSVVCETVEKPVEGIQFAATSC